MTSAKVYPDWVQKFRSKGTTVKMVGNRYYLYKHSSRRVPGKKYPQPVDTYIGLITPDGVVYAQQRKFSLGSTVVRECGFTKTLLRICPKEWKDLAGKNWMDILTVIIVRNSHWSYLRDKNIDEAAIHGSLAVQTSSLNRRLRDKYGVDLKELEPLKGIFYLTSGKKTTISMIDEEQKSLLTKLNVDLEVD